MKTRKYVPALSVPALAEAPFIKKADQHPPVHKNGRTTIRPYITILLILFSFSLFAEPVLQQSFESATTDTWNYTAIPVPNRLVWWGATDQPIGGASAQSGAWYWASWDLDNQSHALQFDSVQLSPGFIYSIKFYYFSKSLNPATDLNRYCIEYDNGNTWTNWQNLQPNTNAWTELSVDIPAYATHLRLKVEALYDGLGKYAHWDAFSVERTPAPPQAPVVYNVSAAQRRDGSKIVDIHYDVFDANNDPATVSVLLSEDSGATFSYQPELSNLSGDIGDGIISGTNKQIVWNAGAESIDFDGSIYRIRVLAEDNNAFVFVEGGTFNNGTSDVTVSSFYMDKYELTQAGYQSVMGSNPASGYGVGSTYPVYYVTWYNAIEYSNRRSLQEGITPCYSYTSYGTNPDSWPSGWNTSSGNHTNLSCNWTANGYRLPTEAEWEFAARGGNQTHNYTYSGSNTIGDVAWYSSNSGSSTHIVGGKLVNELGLYDMNGNVGEWNWDIAGNYPSGSQNNPTGATSGSYRVFRGGSWYSSADYCTVSSRNYTYATYGYNYFGFRLCRFFVRQEN